MNSEPQFAQQPQQPQLFGILIPGHPVRTDFVAADPSGMKFTLTINDVHPSSVSDVAFFLLTRDLPPSHGAILFAQISGSNAGFELVGAVTNDKPSGIFRTSWNTSDSNNPSPPPPPSSNSPSFFSGNFTDVFTSISSPSTITFGVSIETVQNIDNLQITKKGVEERVVDVAKKIALNLFNYLQSFDDSNQSNGMMMVPTNVFERWLTRFQNKYRMDPNFFMKTDS